MNMEQDTLLDSKSVWSFKDDWIPQPASLDELKCEIWGKQITHNLFTALNALRSANISSCRLPKKATKIICDIKSSPFVIISYSPKTEQDRIY